MMLLGGHDQSSLVLALLLLATFCTSVNAIVESTHLNMGISVQAVPSESVRESCRLKHGGETSRDGGGNCLVNAATNSGMEETGNMNPELGPDPVDSEWESDGRNLVSMLASAESAEDNSDPSTEATTEKDEANSVSQHAALGDAEKQKNHLNVVGSNSDSDDTVQRQDEVAGKDEKQAAGPALLDQNAIAADSMEGEGYRNSAAASTLDSPTLADGTRSRTEGTFEEEQENINEKNGPLLTHQEDVPSKKPTENPATTMLPDADSPAAKDVQASPQNFIWGAPDVLSSGKYHSQVHMDFINSPAMAAFSTFESLSPLYSPIEGFGMMSPSMMRDVSGTYLPPVLPSRSPYTGSPYPGVFPGGMSIDPAAGFANTNVGSLYSPNFAAAAGPIPMAGNADRTPSVSMVDNTPLGGVYSPTLRTAASAGSLDGMGLSYTGAIAGVFPDDSGPHPLNGNVGNSGDLSSPSMARRVPSMQFGGPAGIGVSLPNSFFPTTDYQHTVTNGSPGAGIVNGGFSVTPGEGTLSPKRFPSPAFSPFSLGPSTEFHGSQSRGNSGMVRETYQEINNSMQAAGAWSAWSPSRARDPFND